MVYACLGVTCHLHFWHSDQGLQRATAVTQGVERTPNKESVLKVDSGEENSPAAPAEIRTRNLSIASPVLEPTSCPCSQA